MADQRLCTLCEKLIDLDDVTIIANGTRHRPRVRNSEGTIHFLQSPTTTARWLTKQQPKSVVVPKYEILEHRKPEEPQQAVDPEVVTTQAVEEVTTEAIVEEASQVSPDLHPQDADQSEQDEHDWQYAIGDWAPQEHEWYTAEVYVCYPRDGWALARLSNQDRVFCHIKVCQVPADHLCMLRNQQIHVRLDPDKRGRVNWRALEVVLDNPPAAATTEQGVLYESRGILYALRSCGCSIGVSTINRFGDTFGVDDKVAFTVMHDTRGWVGKSLRKIEEF